MVTAFRIQERIIQITGDDRKSYLHGQVTQDINLLDENTYLWAGHCNAKGKLWSAPKLLSTDDSYLAICSEQEAQNSFNELKKYGVFAKAEFELLEDIINIGLIGESIEAIEALLNIEFGEHNLKQCELGYALKLGEGIVQLLIENQQIEKLESFVNISDDENSWRSALIEYGLPRLGSHIDEFVPQMINLQAINGISFTKGCYTGQETVARMKYLGKNKRAMYCLVGDKVDLTDANDVEVKMGDNWRRAGKILQSAIRDEKAYIQAVMPNDISENDVLRIKDQEGAHFSIKALPYTLED